MDDRQHERGGREREEQPGVGGGREGKEQREQGRDEQDEPSRFPKSAEPAA
jgi:hypothetical protein